MDRNKSRVENDELVRGLASKVPCGLRLLEFDLHFIIQLSIDLVIRRFVLVDVLGDGGLLDLFDEHRMPSVKIRSLGLLPGKLASQGGLHANEEIGDLFLQFSALGVLGGVPPYIVVVL